MHYAVVRRRTNYGCNQKWQRRRQTANLRFGRFLQMGGSKWTEIVFMSRAFHCDALDTPHAYIRPKMRDMGDIHDPHQKHIFFNRDPCDIRDPRDLRDPPDIRDPRDMLDMHDLRSKNTHVTSVIHVTSVKCVTCVPKNTHVTSMIHVTCVTCVPLKKTCDIRNPRDIRYIRDIRDIHDIRDLCDIPYVLRSKKKLKLPT